MEIEDGVIWVYGIGEGSVQAFTDFGIENLIELVRIYKENSDLAQTFVTRITQPVKSSAKMTPLTEPRLASRSPT